MILTSVLDVLLLWGVSSHVFKVAKLVVAPLTCPGARIGCGAGARVGCILAKCLLDSLH